MIVDISLSLLEQILQAGESLAQPGIWREISRFYFTLSLRELEHPSFTAQIEALC